jgi:hypothetical protein
MAPLFRAKMLEDKDLRMAWPLVRLANPTVTLAKWVAFARSVRRRRGERAGIMAIQDQRATIHALAIHRTVQSVDGEKLFVVDPLICARLPGRDLDDAIVDALRSAALAIGCTGIVVDTPIISPGSTPIASPLLERGFSLRAMSAFTPTLTTSR